MFNMLVTEVEPEPMKRWQNDREAVNLRLLEEPAHLSFYTKHTFEQQQELQKANFYSIFFFSSNILTHLVMEQIHRKLLLHPDIGQALKKTL